MTSASRSSLLAQVSVVHLVSHFHIMTVPALLPLLPAYMGVGFVELGLALSVFNIVSALVQTPMGFAVDRFGARRVLLFGLVLGSLAFLSAGLFNHYAWLLVAMALAGVANGVYHPGDYALLSQGIEESRMGRAFSVHTFAGYLGAAIAPGLLLGTAALTNPSVAFAVAAAAGLASAAWLALSPPPPLRERKTTRTPARNAARAGRVAVLLTPAVLSLTLLFTLLALSTGAIQNFSVTSLVQGFGVDLAVANTALTAFLFASAMGVLAGGLLADRTRRHGSVAAGSFLLAALLLTTVAAFSLPPLLLIVTLGCTGFLTGLIAPSRDMLVRAASPSGAEGRVFGFVSTGFNIGGAVGPVFFGWLIDGGRPGGVFWASVGFMLCVVAVTLVQEWRGGRMRGVGAPRPAVSR